MDRKCTNCRYFKPGKKADHGECRIEPPTVLATNFIHTGSVIECGWPVIHQDDACGKHRRVSFWKRLFRRNK